jgi:hypothetical protein
MGQNRKIVKITAAMSTTMMPKASHSAATPSTG